MRNKIIYLIKFYKKYFSPFFGRKCRFFPSCSEYAILAIKKYGDKKGLILAGKRITKCHPLHKGGVDLP